MIKTSLLVSIALGASLSLASAQTLSHVYYFEGGNFLKDSVGSADLQQVPAATVTQVGGAARFTNTPTPTGALQTIGTPDLIPGNGSTFSIELIFTLAALPTSRASLFNEITDFSTNSRGFDLYTDNTGRVVTEIGNSVNGQNSGFINSDNGNNPFSLVAGKQYRLGAAYDFSSINPDNAFDPYSATYFLENLTDGGAIITNVVTGTLRNVANPSIYAAIGGRYDNAGTIVNGASVDIAALGIYDGAITGLSLTAVPEPSTVGLIGAALFGAIALRRRTRR